MGNRQPHTVCCAGAKSLTCGTVPHDLAMTTIAGPGGLLQGPSSAMMLGVAAVFGLVLHCLQLPPQCRSNLRCKAGCYTARCGVKRWFDNFSHRESALQTSATYYW